MKSVTVNAFFHRKCECIGFYFERDELVEKIVRSFKRAKWSRTHGCWYILLDKQAFKEAYSLLSRHAMVDFGHLKNYLEKKRQIMSIKLLETGAPSTEVHFSSRNISSFAINAANMDALKSMIKILHLKAYSPKTIYLYRTEILYLMRLLGDNVIDALTQAQIQSYLLWLMRVKHHSESKVHTTINALKFYFEQVLKQQKMFFEIPRPKKPLRLPTVHAEDRVKQIIRQTANLKHRCMLMLAYGTGMRVSEIVALHLKDIVSERMIIHIKDAKGKKDRIVTLPGRLLQELREYYKIYKPKRYVFEGAGGEQYSIRSVQKVFETAKARAGVMQSGGIHSMRHSYATHLLEHGTDIRVIQDLLGHNNLRTTERYTHVSIKYLEKVQSPLDHISWNE